MDRDNIVYDKHCQCNSANGGGHGCEFLNPMEKEVAVPPLLTATKNQQHPFYKQ